MSRNLNIASGDVDTEIKRTATGIHTVEGNVAGARAARLTKQREEQSSAYEAQKKKLQSDIQRGAQSMDSRFNTASLEFKGQAIGLMSKEEFARTSTLEDEPSIEEQEKAKAAADNAEKRLMKKKKKAKKRAAAGLSFGGDDDDGDDDESGMGKGGGGSSSSKVIAKKRIKNPNVNTDFLPDKDREASQQERREELQKQWEEEQVVMKEEKLEVTYSYWDGSGHRRTINVTKGTTVGKFLENVRMACAADFHELRTMGSDGLLYVKEDLIVPSHYSFYDLIVTKARGKSGPLFHFDVHDDVRIVGGNDSRIEKDESHPGKIVSRGWYERNKHIFPASRWEMYDPNVQRETYTIHGGEVQEKNN